MSEMSFSQVPSRPTPALPPGAYQSYELSAPATTHRRPASCEEFGCDHYAKGWATTVQAASEDEALLLRACRGEVDGRRRRALQIKQPSGFVQYVFEPGQPCFSAGKHTVHNDREAIGIRRAGDHRGNPSGEILVHSNLDNWVEDFGEHQQNLSDAAEKG